MARAFTVTTQDYVRLQYLYKAVSRDFSRMSLTKVYYDKDKEWFVATDGHQLRVEKVEWDEQGKPDASFFLDYNQVMLTKRQLNAKYTGNDFFDRQVMRDARIPIEYIPADEHPCNPYPNVNSVIPKIEDREDLEYQALKPSNMRKFFSSFRREPHNVQFVFTRQLGAVMVNVQDFSGEAFRFAGLLMPTCVLGDTAYPRKQKPEAQPVPA